MTEAERSEYEALVKKECDETQEFTAAELARLDELEGKASVMAAELRAVLGELPALPSDSPSSKPYVQPIPLTKEERDEYEMRMLRELDGGTTQEDYNRLRELEERAHPEPDRSKAVDFTELMKKAAAERWYHVLYQAFIVDETDNLVRETLFHPFTSGRSQAMSGNPSVKMTHTLTNLPRSGIGGMPKQWSCDVERITVVSDRDVLDQPALESARISLSRDMRTWLGPRHLSRTVHLVAAPENMITLPEMTPYWCDVIVPSGSDDLCTAVPSVSFKEEIAAPFERALAHYQHPVPDEYGHNGGARHREQLLRDRHMIGKHALAPGKTVFWVFLEGWGQRVIV